MKTAQRALIILVCLPGYLLSQDCEILIEKDTFVCNISYTLKAFPPGGT